MHIQTTEVVDIKTIADMPVDEVKDSETETIEIITVPGENEHNVLNASEVHCIDTILPSISSTVSSIMVENAHLDGIQEVCSGNIEADKICIDVNDAVEILNKSTDLELETNQNETIECHREEEKTERINLSSTHDSDSKDVHLDITDNKNNLCLNESNVSEIDSSKILCSKDDFISTTVNISESGSMTLDEDMFPDCENQNCNHDKQSQHQSLDVPNEAECDQQTIITTTNEQTILQVMVNENLESEVLNTETNTAEVTSKTNLVEDTCNNDLNVIVDEKDASTINKKNNDALVSSKESSADVEVNIVLSDVLESETIESVRICDSKNDSEPTSMENIETIPTSDKPMSNDKEILEKSTENDIEQEKQEVKISVKHKQSNALQDDHMVEKETEDTRECETAVKSNTLTCIDSDDIKKTDICTTNSRVLDTPKAQRSVVQDIVDDWTDENQEDVHDCQKQPSKSQDSVEIELKSLLDDEKSHNKTEERKVDIFERKSLSVSNEYDINMLHGNSKVSEQMKSKNIIFVSIDHEHKDLKRESSKKDMVSVNKEIPSYIPPHMLGRSPKNPIQDPIGFKHKPQSLRPGVKIPGRHLTSQIASTAEVTEVLKERLRQQQKDLEAPQGPDIFFVKKITQRLSNKLSAGSANPVPALIPLPQSAQPVEDNHENKTIENVKTESNKGETDNRELLAILEGDVDPDWSNLKPPTLTEENKSPETVVEHNTPPKLDPLVERELALKQLLELPSIAIKKSTPKKKKTFKPAPSKAFKVGDKASIEDNKKKIVNIDLIDEDLALIEKHKADEKLDLLSDPVNKDDLQNEQLSISDRELRADESRSGRKRKPTEKAREHEQNISKRQKVYKGKVPTNKRVSQEQSTLEVTLPEETEEIDDKLSSKNVESEQSHPTEKEVTSKQNTDKSNTSTVTLNRDENSCTIQSEQSLVKKGSQSIAKRKMAVKKLLRQKTSSSKKSVNLKSKLTISSKKSGSKVTGKAQKRPTEVPSGDVKPKKRPINEIDKLLQDEGVVNLLYDVEQPDKKRLIPITKSQTKVMDIQKVQRELKIRTKLVRNAVLRLRTSGVGTTKVSPRSKRSVAYSNGSQYQQKASEHIKSRSTVSSPTEFIFPAKIRNAADASIIIRRHSSSSFSSASGSPRVSIDGPEKQTIDSSKVDEAGTHVLRSTKRRHSQDDKIKTDLKKSKKKTIQKTEIEKAEPKTVVGASTDIVEEKGVVATRSNKRTDVKKLEKMTKQPDVIDVDDSSSSNFISKVVTRSNGTSTGKQISKNKKPTKCKVTFAKPTDTDTTEEPSKEEDELSVCLAEAATALSNVSGVSCRSGNVAVNRKYKGNASVGKTSEIDGVKKQKVETGNQFSNKEINIRRHGNLVQLILTPSSPTKTKNGITLQVMREFRETLSILKRDEECRVVLLTSTGGSFCEGLELSGLLCANKEERRVHAQEMANGVKDFIKSLATFNKPIVAGVQGAAVGLGVTMLPLFDLVIASDKATFSTPYAKLGQIAEGAAILTLSHTLGSAVTSELLLGGRTLTANEALRAGLVTRVLWPDRFQGDLLPSLRAMSEQSSQSMEAMKALLRHSLRKKLDAALESESYLLVQHWCSAECQAAIKAYIDGKIQ